MLYPLRFKPVYKDYIWGGRSLADLGKILPGTGIVAESWEISGHPNGPSIIANGPLAGRSLPDVVLSLGRTLLGSIPSEHDLARFPLLIKLIDAHDQLSVQVHPDDNYARIHEHGEDGKNEMWYVVSARPGARLVAGVRPGVKPECFLAAIKDGTCLDLLQSIPVKAGDVVNIPAGLVHAIGDGLVICEIQQNSDTTYRVYDYDRRDGEGKLRPLHIEKAMQVINFNSSGASHLISGLFIRQGDLTRRVLVMNRYFTVEEQRITGEADFCGDGSRFRTITVLEGQGSLTYTLSNGVLITEPLFPGDSLLIPACFTAWHVQGSLMMITGCPTDFAADTVSLAGDWSRTEGRPPAADPRSWLKQQANDGLIAIEPGP